MHILYTRFVAAAVVVVGAGEAQRGLLENEGVIGQDRAAVAWMFMAMVMVAMMMMVMMVVVVVIYMRRLGLGNFGNVGSFLDLTGYRI